MLIHYDSFSHEEKYSKMHSMIRICYNLDPELAKSTNVKITNLSREEIEIIYELPWSVIEGYVHILNKIRLRSKSIGAIDPDTADRMIKGVYDVMES
jgi:hypothetical protein